RHADGRGTGNGGSGRPYQRGPTARPPLGRPGRGACCTPPDSRGSTRPRGPPAGPVPGRAWPARAAAATDAAPSRAASAGLVASCLQGAGRGDGVKAGREAPRLPLLLGSTPGELSDRTFLAAQGVRIALQGHHPFYAAAQAVYDTLKYLREGGAPSGLKD